jgi:hypothetical protein
MVEMDIMVVVVPEVVGETQAVMVVMVVTD